MKKKILSLVFAAVAVFFSSCGNTVSAGKEKIDSKKAVVSFSASVNKDTLLNDGARAGETDSDSANTAINPADVTEKDIKKVELKVASVTKAADGTTTETISVFGDGTEKQTFSSIDEFQNATFQLDIGTYTFYLDLFVAQGEGEKTEYVLVQSGKITEELKAGENLIAINTKYVESGEVSFTFNWKDLDSRVAKVKIGLYSGELDSLGEVNDFAPVQVTITNSEGECSAVYNASSVPNGSYQIGVTLLDKKDNLLNTFYYPLTVYGYKSFGSKNIASDYNKNYYITYNYNDGTVVKGKDSYFAEVFNQNSIIYLPDSSCIERSGYDFQGWYTSPDFNEDDFVKIINAPLLAGDNILSDFTLYAKWTPVVNKTASGTILFNNENIGYTITMTIDEPFTLNSGSASFDIVLADGTDLVSDGILANTALNAQSEEEMFPAVCTYLMYGGYDVNDFAEIPNNESTYYAISKDSEMKESAEVEEGESLYTKPSISINPAVPLDAPGKYQIQVLLMLSMSNIVVETFDISVENKIDYVEDVTDNGGNISLALSNILKNRTQADVNVKVTGKGVDDSGTSEVVVAGTIHQIASSLLNAGIFIDNNINIDLSELTDVTSVPERCFCIYKRGTYIGKDFASIVLPEGIKEIGDEAFNGCSTFSSITIPESVTAIGSKAFYGCSNLSDIKGSLKNVKIIEDKAFVGLPDGSEINITDCSLCGIYGEAFDSGCELNISWPTDANYYVLALDDEDNYENAGGWWNVYKEGVLDGTMTTEVFEALDWYINVETINDADPEEISIPYTDPRHTQYGWEPTEGDEDPPEDEFIMGDGVPAWKVFQNSKFNDSDYIQFIVPNN